MKTTVGMGMAVAGVIGLSTFANAADWQLRPTVAVGAEYDDNIRLAAKNEESTSGAWLTGAVEFGSESEIQETKGRLRLDFINYANSKVPDENNQYFNFTTAHKGQLNTLRLDAAARRDTTIVTDRVPTSPEDIDVALTTTQVRRTRATISPSWRHQLSQRTDVGMAYAYLGTTYDKNVLVDYHRHDLKLDVGHNLSERDRLTVNVGASDYRAPDANKKYDTVSVVGEYERHLSETFLGVIGVGARRTNFDIPGESNGQDSGAILRLRGERKGERTTWDGLVERSVYPSGSGDVVEADQLVLQVRHKLRPLLEFSMRARFLKQHSIVNNGSNQDTRYVYVEPKLAWLMSRELSLSASYRYRRKSGEANTPSADSNAAYVELTYAAL